MSDLDLITILRKLDDVSEIVSRNGGYAHIEPLPEVESYYSKDQFYQSHSPVDWFVKEADEYENGLWDSYFKHLIKSTRYNYSHPGALQVLDIGCGSGILLDFWQRYTGDITIGIEPSKIAREWARSKRRNIHYLLDDRSQLAEQLDDKKIDIMLMVLVLEHIPGPDKFLQSYVDILPPKGRVLIVVPNDFNRLQKKLGYEGFISPVHQNYFTPVTLQKLMEDVGLRVVRKSSTFAFELFALAGINYFGNDVIGRKCHQWRLMWEKAIGYNMFKVYQAMFNQWGIGRELIFVGEKI